MKILKKLGLILSIIILSAILFACGDLDFGNKVVFVVGDQIYATIEPDEFDQFVLPDNPTKEGHVFEGWYWDKNEWDLPFYEDDIPESFMTKEMQVYALWSKAEYAVTFDGAGGNLVEGTEEQTVEFGGKAKAPTYERTGYTYTWDKSFNKVTESMVITAVWSIKTYTVTFNRNGGALISGEETQTIEHNGAALAPVFEKEGHTYTWDKTFDAITSNISITAVWSINNYSVTFDANGGELAEGETSQTVTHGSNAEPPVFVKTGYSLSWDISLDSIKAETVITAVWTINEYSVVFSGNGGTLIEGEEEQTVKHGEAATAPVYHKTGYTGFWGDAGFSSVTGDMVIEIEWIINLYNVIFVPENYLGGEHISGELEQEIEYLGSPAEPEFYRKGYTLVWEDYSVITGDTEINGVWEINVYTVTFDGAQGVLVSGQDNQSVQYSAAAEAPVYSRNGYTFNGWDIPFDAVEDNITVTALWEINKYTVTFIGNGGALVSGAAEQEVEHGGFAAVPVFEMTGYNLSWDAPFWNITEDTQITAVWTIKSYTVTFEGNGGTRVSGETIQTVKHGQFASAPVFLREGYNFIEWNNDFSNITSDIIVTALWEIKTYTVSFIGNGGMLESGEAEQTVEHGSPADEPVFNREGYAFGGWFTDNGSFENEYDFISPTVEDFEIYAKWYIKLSNMWGTESPVFTEVWGDVFYDKPASMQDGGDLESVLIQLIGQDLTVVEVLKSEGFPYLAIEIGAKDLNKVQEILDALKFLARIQGLSTVLESPSYRLLNGTTTIAANLFSTDHILEGGVEHENDAYFAVNKSILVRYMGTEDVYQVPGSVTIIANRAFENNSFIREVIIPSYVEQFGGRAFTNVQSLTAVTFTGTSRLNAIGESAFFNSANITSMILPLSIEKIGANAFFGATGLAVFAEAEVKPEGFVTGWNKLSGSSFATVVWGSVLSPDKSFVVSGINTYDGSGAAKIANPARVDYDFDGWYRTENFSGARFDDLSLAPNGRLFAKWSGPKYTLFFNSNGGSYIEAIRDTMGAEIQIPAPAREGYLFDGWYTDNDIFERPYITNLIPGASIVLHARWIDELTIIYVNPADNIVSKIAQAPEGSTILINEGEYITDSTITLANKSMTIKGIGNVVIRKSDSGAFSNSNRQLFTATGRGEGVGPNNMYLRLENITLDANLRMSTGNQITVALNLISVSAYLRDITLKNVRPFFASLIVNGKYLNEGEAIRITAYGLKTVNSYISVDLDGTPNAGYVQGPLDFYYHAQSASHDYGAGNFSISKKGSSAVYILD